MATTATQYRPKLNRAEIDGFYKTQPPIAVRIKMAETTLAYADHVYINPPVMIEGESEESWLARTENERKEIERMAGRYDCIKLLPWRNEQAFNQRQADSAPAPAPFKPKRKQKIRRPGRRVRKR